MVQVSATRLTPHKICKSSTPRPIAETTATNEALADVGGVNIHAGAAIDGRDRRRLERLCRYVARPPVSQERLSLAPDGRRLTYAFKRAWRDGSYAVVLEPLDLMARLAALTPPPNFHLLRYHGVLAAHANARSEVIPGPAPEPPEPIQLRLVFDGEATELEPAVTPSRHAWAWLLQRVFAVDAGSPDRLRCDRRRRAAHRMTHERRRQV